MVNQNAGHKSSIKIARITRPFSGRRSLRNIQRPSLIVERRTSSSGERVERLLGVFSLSNNGTFNYEIDEATMKQSLNFWKLMEMEEKSSFTIAISHQDLQIRTHCFIVQLKISLPYRLSFIWLSFILLFSTSFMSI